MTISGVSNSPYSSVLGQKEKTGGSSLDKDAFLNLLVTQLRNQNPLQPMEDKEFIAQMAQFTALEQTQSMNKTIKMNSAYNLTNKYAYGTYRDEESSELKEVEGLVEKASFKDNNVYVTINGKEILFDDVKEVTETISNQVMLGIMNQNIKLSSASSFIGKEVKAKYYDSTEKKYIDVEGLVETVIVKNNAVFLSVNQKNVLLEDIYQVK